MAPEASPIEKNNPARIGLPDNPLLENKKGFKYANDDADLRGWIDLYHELEFAFTGLVVFGVGCEFFIDFLHLPHDSYRAIWWPTIANAIVFVGLILEMIFGRRMKSLEDELTRRSNERVAKAQRETERLRAIAAWRVLSKEQHEAIFFKLRELGNPASIRFSVLMHDLESRYFAQTIARAFEAAGWSIGYVMEMHDEVVFTGILLPDVLGAWPDSKREAQKTARSAFEASGLWIASGWPRPASRSSDVRHLEEPIAHVYVGPKPPVLL